MIFVLMMWDILSRIVSWIPNLPIPMELFNEISMIIATIALFYVGKPYLVGVTRFVQYRVANIGRIDVKFIIAPAFKPGVTVGCMFWALAKRKITKGDAG